MPDSKKTLHRAALLAVTAIIGAAACGGEEPNPPIRSEAQLYDIAAGKSDLFCPCEWLRENKPSWFKTAASLGLCSCAEVMCALYCEHGFVQGADGCAQCKCAEPPACESPLCTELCEYGLQQDARGCATCECVDPYACNQSADCALAKADCCGCQAGGASVAINNEHKALFEQLSCAMADVICTQRYRCAGETPVCAAGRCELVP